MNELEASLGLSQFKRLGFFVKKRNLLAKNYNKSFKNLPIIYQKILINNYSSYHLYIIKIDKTKTNKTRNQLYKFLERKKFNLTYIIYQFINNLILRNIKIFHFPNSEEYFKSAITLPLHTKLTKKDQDYIINSIKSFFK